MAKSSGLTVAITGASGYIAGRLIELLEEDPQVERILGFDVREPVGLRTSKLVFDKIDVRDPALESRFKGVDLVIHLAYVMDPIRDEAQMRDVNVNGTQNVLKCAGRAGVPRLVYTSSGVAYGAHPDNDMPLTEESPLRANLDFNYAAHKLETEYVVREFRDEFPDRKIAVFRPAIVFGEHCDSAWSHQLELPVLFSIQSYEPPFQFVHEEDVARALAFSVANELDGAYNLCPRDWLEFAEIASILGKRRLRLPEPAAFAMADRMWTMNVGEIPAGYLHYVMYPWVMSPEKLEAAGFKCEHSSYDALTEMIRRTKTRLRMGRVGVKKSDLTKGGLAGAGLLAGALVVRGFRRRSA